jgi:tRNA (guanine37-N1)-methyltransferase
LKEAPAIEVPLQRAQTILSILRGAELIDTDLELCRTDKTLTIPLTRLPSNQIISHIRELNAPAIITKQRFVESARPPRNLIEAVKSQIPINLLEYLPRSYDIIGDIAIVDLAEPIHPFATTVGKAILQINPHIRLVVRKLGIVSGTYRIRNLEILVGSGCTETEHHEYSCRYTLDLSTVYFNPRLSNERMRVAKQVRFDETVVDMFAGVGPFSILIAKMHSNARVYACDINPAAVKYLKKNIILNRLVDRVIPLLVDAGKLGQEDVRSQANRVIMNLPSKAESYLPVAVNLLGSEGTIHYYTFASRNESVDDIRMKVQDVIQSAGRTVRSFSFADVIREIAPGRVQVAMDVLIQ